MKKNKTWVRPKEQIIICGYCEICNKELTSIMGGWITTSKKKRFCHDGKEGSCFDNYCEERKLKAEDSTY